jgi:putative colanic acid biosynthesis UDP-glucose lipid carrier transferase
MRFSKYLLPLQIFVDLIVIAILWGVTTQFFGVVLRPEHLLITYVTWLFSVYLEGNYKLKRFSRTPKILRNLTRLGAVFLGVNMFFQEVIMGRLELAMFLPMFHFLFLISMFTSRVFAIRIIRQYRSLGLNYRNILFLGDTPDIQHLRKNFSDGNDFGIRVSGLIDNGSYSFENFKNQVKSKLVDEIFIAPSLFDLKVVDEIINYAENNLIKIRVVPNFAGLFSSNLKLDYVGNSPVLVYREVALDDIINATVKRTFDVIFSLFMMIFVLSWLVPLMALIIKWESKGPVVFKQKRSGINNQDFDCYKFRSMAVNEESHSLQSTKGDARVTKVGAFIRKTSIDELPQFFNVFMGDMSVVGPRPHMVKHTSEFSEKVDRYMLRHAVKPGITGLAQTRGYRGETKTQQDIKGRVTLDRFYVENWNFFLDVKIIIKTLLNGVKGDEKAY